LRDVAGQVLGPAGDFLLLLRHVGGGVVVRVGRHGTVGQALDRVAQGTLFLRQAAGLFRLLAVRYRRGRRRRLVSLGARGGGLGAVRHLLGQAIEVGGGLG